MPDTKILIRAPKAPQVVVSPDASLAHGPNGVFGSNSGNLLFAESVFRAIATESTEVVPDSFTTERPGSGAAHAARIDREFDAFVVPLANAFREQFRPALRRLTHVIEKLTIPVVVTGVGAQLPPSGKVSGVSADLRTDVENFMRAVLKRSTSVGVRGEMTADFLRQLGFSDSEVDIIGCPSMYDFGAEAPTIDKTLPVISPSDPLALNITPTAPWARELLKHHLAGYPNCVYIPQEHPDLALLLWNQRIDGRRGASPTTPEDRWLGEDRMRFFVDATTWHDFMRTRAFSFGHRIHGNIAALAAGVPAVVLTFDSRTTELADYHGIPSIPAKSLDRSALDVNAIYERADFTALNSRREQTRSSWLAFLERNGIAYNAPDAGPSTLDESIAAAHFPPGIGPSRTTQDLVARTRWLRNETLGTNPERYVPPFSPRSHRSVEEKLAILQSKCDDLAEAVRDVRAENDALRAELDAAREPKPRKLFRTTR